MQLWLALEAQVRFYGLVLLLSWCTYVVGSHGLGVMNERGRILQEWCHENELCILNTWFQKKDEKLWTCRRADGIIKNQIDFILIQKRFFNAILDRKPCSDVDCGSDRNPVIAKRHLRLRYMNHILSVVLTGISVPMKKNQILDKCSWLKP